MNKIIFIIFVVGIVAFGLLRSESIFRGPVIVVESPIAHTTYYGDVPILAYVERAVSITLNGKDIAITPEGVLRETLYLPEGYNVITLTAIDSRKRVLIMTIPITLEYEEKN